MNKSRLLFSLAATVAAMTTVMVVSAAWAHQPSSLAISLGKHKVSRRVDLSPAARKGDAKIEVLVTNDDPYYHALVKFPACTIDEGAAGPVLSNLEDVLRNGVRPLGLLRPEGGPDPVWTACLLSKSKAPGVFRVKTGETIKLKMIVDFRSLGKQHVRIVGEVHGLFNDGIGKLSETAQKIIDAKRLTVGMAEEFLKLSAPAAELPLSLFYDVFDDSKKGP